MSTKLPEDKRQLPREKKDIVREIERNRRDVSVAVTDLKVAVIHRNPVAVIWRSCKNAASRFQTRINRTAMEADQKIRARPYQGIGFAFGGGAVVAVLARLFAPRRSTK